MLGTMPSPKSREVGSDYGHSQELFLEGSIGRMRRGTSTDKGGEDASFALRNRIAVWDVLAGCDIKGADDGSIRNPKANDMKRILDYADIRAIFTTGTKAARLVLRDIATLRRGWRQSDFHPPARPTAGQPTRNFTGRIG